MIDRNLRSVLEHRLTETPAVALLGPRQAGKTTLALDIADDRQGPFADAHYLDLESEQGRARMADPEAYLAPLSDRLVILDEVQRMPGLFQSLRGLIDRGRRAGRRAGHFLLLGSASMDLLRQSSESLAGRIAYLELGPFGPREIPDIETLWLRGGFPDSVLAPDDAASLRWRRDLIRTYLERDIPQLGPRIAAETLRRFWTMLAHAQGGLLNASALARGLGVDGKTIGAYLDLMVDLLLVRRLEPWAGNVSKRLVKSPKVYIRDSGLVHALLGLETRDDILGHPIAGASWEGLVIENLIMAAPDGTRASFFRSAAGAECDLVLETPRTGTLAIEIKRSSTPKVSRGFWIAAEDVQADRRLVVYPGEDRWIGENGAEILSLADALADI
ncbi:MAG: ATP-binding protein, partial [Pseudomonadota bacterium]